MKLRNPLPLFIRHSLIAGVLALCSTTSLFAQEDVPINDLPVALPDPPADPNEPLIVVEQMPEFPGGQQALFAYIGKELKYPAEAIDSGIEGAVFISFVVERDGGIGEAEVLRGIGGGCSEEALRVVQGMPKWKPGMQGGKVVRTRFNLPIRFKLQDKKEPKD